MYHKLEKSVINSLLKLHILTGCDVTSKVSTNSAAIKATQEVNLVQNQCVPPLMSCSNFFVALFPINHNLAFNYRGASFNCLIDQFNPIQDGPSRGCSRMGRGQKGPLFLKLFTHTLQWWNFAHLYLNQRRSKKSINHVTHPISSADISIFSPEIDKFCYIKKCRYR